MSLALEYLHLFSATIWCSNEEKRKFVKGYNHGNVYNFKHQALVHLKYSNNKRVFFSLCVIEFDLNGKITIAVHRGCESLLWPLIVWQVP